MPLRLHARPTAATYGGKSTPRPKRAKAEGEQRLRALFPLGLPPVGASLLRLTCRDARQKLSASCGPWRGAMPARGGRSLLTFSRGSRACAPFSCCAAEMFFSLFYLFFMLLFTHFGLQK